MSIPVRLEYWELGHDEPRTVIVKAMSLTFGKLGDPPIDVEYEDGKLTLRDEDGNLVEFTREQLIEMVDASYRPIEEG